MSPLRPPRLRATALSAALLAALAVPPGSTSAATPDDLAAHRAALAEMRADAHAGSVTAEIASYDAWLRAAASHADYGHSDALGRTLGRLDAQRGLIEARLSLAGTRADADAARDRLRALDRRINDARAERALLERHQERTRKRGQ